MNLDKLISLLTDNIHATLIDTDSTNTAFFTSSSFRNGADKHRIKKQFSFKHLLRELNSGRQILPCWVCLWGWQQSSQLCDHQLSRIHQCNRASSSRSGSGRSLWSTAGWAPGASHVSLHCWCFWEHRPERSSAPWCLQQGQQWVRRLLGTQIPSSAFNANFRSKRSKADRKLH